MKPLQGVRVLSVEAFGAGPYGSMLLAGLGAEVVKIENPAAGGDPARRVGPSLLGPGDSEYFQSWNLGKRSVALDLKSGDGRRQFERLVATAHAVINNLRGDQPAKLRLDYAALGRINRAVVCLHISAYGRDNQRAAWPGYDYLMQAETGLMSLTGEPEGPPARFGASVVDCLTGATGMVGLLACLMRAQRTGEGCDVDVSLFDIALHQLGYVGTWCLNGGHATTRQERSSHFSLAPVQTFPTADGWIFVMCMTEKFWRALLTVLGRAELGRDPRFANAASRHGNRGALTAILDAEFRRHATAHWLDILSGLLPVGPVNDLRQALANPFVERTGMVRDAPHPHRPGLRVLANPIKVNGVRGEQAVCPPMGADNAALLDRAIEPGGATQR